MKHILVGLLLAVSQPFIFCQDASLFARIDSLENTVQLLSKHIERQDELIQLLQNRDDTQQTRIEKLENIVKVQQKIINDVSDNSGKEISRLYEDDVLMDMNNNENQEPLQPLDGDRERIISGEHLHVKSLGKSLTREVPEAVAFHATIDVQTHITQLTKGQTIVFDSVHLNIGGGYHSSAGIFIAPTSGIYMFSLSVMINTQTTWISLDLLKNGAILAEAYASDYNQGSVSVTTQLKTGDEVIVKVHGSNLGMVYGEKMTSFMGMLVMQY